MSVSEIRKKLKQLKKKSIKKNIQKEEGVIFQDQIKKIKNQESKNLENLVIVIKVD